MKVIWHDHIRPTCQASALLQALRSCSWACEVANMRRRFCVHTVMNTMVERFPDSKTPECLGARRAAKWVEGGPASVRAVGVVLSIRLMVFYSPNSPHGGGPSFNLSHQTSLIERKSMSIIVYIKRNPPAYSSRQHTAVCPSRLFRGLGFC